MISLGFLKWVTVWEAFKGFYIPVFFPSRVCLQAAPPGYSWSQLLVLQLSPPRTQGSPQVLAMPPLVVSEWDHLGGAAAAGGACGEEGPRNSLFQPVGQSNSQESTVKCFRGSSGDSRFQVSPLFCYGMSVIICGLFLKSSGQGVCLKADFCAKMCF